MIAETGASLGAIDLVRVETGSRSATSRSSPRDADHIEESRPRSAHSRASRWSTVSDRTFLLHLGGKIEVALEGAAGDARRPLDGVHARRRTRLAGDRRRSREGWSLTIKRNTVAVVSRRDGGARARRHRSRGGDARDGGQGDALQGVRRRRRVAGCLATKDTDEIVAASRRSRPVYGGINLEDISAPRCFEIEERLRATLDIPVFHDDQHGTAIVVLRRVPERAARRRQAPRGRARSWSPASAPPASR